MALLSVQNVTMRFGGLLANDNISFDVPEGSIFAVIGPNGAGKTTLFNSIAGSLKPTSGKVVFDGQPITGLPQAAIASRGLIRTYQLVQLFKDLTVAENVEIGFHRVTRGGVGSALLRPRWFREQEESIARKARELLAFVGLGDQADMIADKLPYGRQRLLEVARALAAEPRLILLDEPAAGLNTQETAALADVIHRVNERGVTVLLIEHDMGLVMKVAQRIAVLDFGKKIAEGTPDEIRSHPDVLTAYLGGVEMADG
ncbi:ABC transporter ATP-binding protein [Alsobacter metallidurans]|uniref:ABC transporter ATP-binding protein n=1 Tax=Alsobacter metallidurans TaxID=340221 RepID=A0A917I5A8_9HYPH|nr:ABC transporter ATP-binding protein [Alsobacter metallidurans]GGH12709.1 ABC transporter ATP-binding protein [Alsobacter metallidurans]